MTPFTPLAIRVCHDNPLLRAGLVSLIGQAPDLDVRAGQDCGDEHPVDVIVAGYGCALDLLASAPASPCSPPIVVVTRRDTERDVVHAINSGVHGYLLQDSGPLELISSIRHVARGGSRYLCRRAAPLLEGAHRPELTPREDEVLHLLANGECNKSIARKLDISSHTVKAHVSKICEKLHVHSRVQAAAVAAQRGLVRT
ncbi:response regulator transcription factor [Variovorax sp. OV329]|uniref:LuxR C-terminal-related transcriptional regulator n=1 Tax=Variovorax sp. OV329 TaxID=1882825 RepID=UPI0008E10622|nr:response regulator transcription factor [Variovorax sp. OV329]SFM68672.1 DNA-binding response regulator, NarL/FixJ family, contains REC and HTH domains [Variovorax sp. OV329]